MSPIVISGVIQSREGITTYQIKIDSSTDKELLNCHYPIVIDPHSIVVNGIKYEAQEVDKLFVEKTLIGKRVMFIIKKLNEESYQGVLYKLPFGVGRAIEIPQMSIDNKLKAS